MIPFDEIDARLEKLGKDRDWLSEQTKRSPRSIGDALAPGASHLKRSRHLQKALSDAIEQEEVRRKSGDQKPQELPPCHLVIKVDVDEFNGWERLAASKSPAQAVTDYCVAAIRAAYLEDLAAAEKRADSRSNVVNISDSEQIVSRFQESPLILAAAGSPIGAEIENGSGLSDIVRVRINGLSMDPLLVDGQIVEMKHRNTSRSPFMKKGLIYLVEYDGGYTVKRYNTRKAKPEEAGEEWVEGGKVKVLESINPEFPEIIIKQPMEWVAWLDLKDQ